MKTTIQVERTTLELLKRVKGRTKSKSYDEAIRKMAIEGLDIESMWGFLGKGTRKDVMEGLRDKSDRF